MSSGPGGGFPFQDPPAKSVFGNLPEGLILDRSVLDEFLDPSAPVEWFVNKAWAGLSYGLDGDKAVSYADYAVLEDACNALRSGLTTWFSLRDPATATEGWGATSKDMRAAGAGAYYDGILKIVTKAEELDPKVGAATQTLLRNFCAVAWEYAECMALEMEASVDGIAVTDLLDRVNKGIADPWEPALTPENIGDYTVIGVSRLPALPAIPDLFGEDLPPDGETDPGADAEWSEEEGDGGR
jgi:hypothetical protein